VDIQAEAFDIDIDRGIQIEEGVFARPKIGTATVRLQKKSLYDLLNPTGPAYKSNNLFRIQAEITSGGWLNLFSGVIQNFTVSYNQDAKKVDVTITANDYMKIGLGTNISSFSIGGGASRSYINVMNQLGTAINGIDSRFTLARAGTGASATYQRSQVLATTDDPISSGEIFNQFLDAELGWMWTDRDNQTKYLTRTDVTALQAATFSGTSGVIVSNIHSSSSNHVCMDFIDLTYRSDEIANQVRVENLLTGIKTTRTNSTSVTNFGRQLADFAVDFQPTVTGDTAPPTTYGDWATEVSNAATPRRLAGVSVPMITDAGEISNIVTKDIGDYLKVEFAATGFSNLQEVSIITNLNHTITPEHWELNVGLWEGV
jgi:hypothetical protein